MSLTLYPPIEPYQSGRLQVDDLHSLYWETCGNPHGAPILFVHGGPGEGCDPQHRRFFDPDHYRIILFDQRGAKRSTPLAERRNNTPAHAVSDIEALRTALAVDRWILFGGSWGSALALHYAQTHRQCCAGLILRGISLFERDEAEWWFYGMGRFFPELWEKFAAAVPDAERGGLARAYARMLSDREENTRLRALKAIDCYARACGSFGSKPTTTDFTSSRATDRLLAFYQIFLHFSLLHRFEKGSLLRGLKGLDGIIVQGGYDLVCPPATAHRLHRAWPGSRYVLVPEAGHSSFEPAMATALRDATDAFKTSGHKMRS